MNYFKLHNAMPSVYTIIHMHAEIHIYGKSASGIALINLSQFEHFDSYLIMGCELEGFDREI